MRRTKRSLWARARDGIHDTLARVSRRVLGSPEARLQFILPRLDIFTKRLGNRPKSLERWKAVIVRLCLAPEASPAAVLRLVHVHLSSLMALFSGDARCATLIEAVAWRECRSHLRAVFSDPRQTIVAAAKQHAFVEVLKYLDDPRYRLALEAQMVAALRRSMSRQTNPGLERLVQKFLDDRQMLDPSAPARDASSVDDLPGCASLHGSAVAAALAATPEDMRSMVVAGVAVHGYRFSEYVTLSARLEPWLYGPPAVELAGVVKSWQADQNATSRADEAEARARYFLDVLAKAPALARVAASHVLRLPRGHPLRDEPTIRAALDAQLHTAIDQLGTVDPLGPDFASNLSLALSAMAGLIGHTLVSSERTISLINAGRSLLANTAFNDTGQSFRLAAMHYLHDAGRDAEAVNLLTPLVDVTTDPISRRALSILRDNAAGDAAKVEATLSEMADQVSDDPRAQKAQLAGARMEATRAFGRAEYDRVIDRLVHVVPVLEAQYLSAVLDEDVATAAQALAEAAVQLAFAYAHQDNWDAAVTTIDRTKSLRFRYQSALRADALGGELRELEADIHARTRGVEPPAAVRRQTPAGLTELLETYRQMREKAKVRIAGTGIADIATHLDEGEAVAVLGDGPGELLVSIVRVIDGVPSIQAELLPAGDSDTVHHAIANVQSGWLVALGFKGQFVDPRSSLQQLLAIVDRVIGQPITRLLGDRAVRRITVIPHGPLHLLPFWALPSMAAFAVMVAPSAAQFVAARRAGRRLDPRALVVGNPTSDLALAGVEARVVRRHLAGNGFTVNLLEREQATEPALVQAVADASLFHFSGHGRSEFTAPVSSALEVCPETPAHAPGEDPLLSIAAHAAWQPTYVLAGTEWIDDTNQRWADVADHGRLVQRVYPSAQTIDLRLNHRARGTLLARYARNTEETGSEYGRRLRVSELWTAGDILTDRCFSACGLAVLSSCEAGAGGVSFSVDEFGGLPAALQLAGVATVVSPLWPVGVEVALLFFDLFYAALTRTSETADVPALVQQAQRRLRRMRREEAAARLSALAATAGDRAARLTLDAASRRVAQGDERPFSHPYDWAAFHVVGAPVLAVPFAAAQMEAVGLTSHDEEDETEEPIVPQPDASHTPAVMARADVFQLGRDAETLLAATDDPNVRSAVSPFLFDRGMAHLRAGDTERAMADFNRVAEISPEPADAHRQLAEIHADRGQYEEALKHYDLALARRDDSATRVGRSHVHASLDHIAEALEDLERAIALAADGDAAFDAYVSRGVVHRADGRPQDAVDDLTQALARRPESAAAYNERGLALLDLDRAAQSVPDFTRAIALEPGWLHTYSNRGLAYTNLGNYDLALADHDHALSKDPNHVANRFNRACALSRKHDMASIVEDVRVAIDGDPSLVNHAKSDADLEWARATSPELRALLGIDALTT
jgi:tetratricopeptide (TPR) repeat protein